MSRAGHEGNIYEYDFVYVIQPGTGVEYEGRVVDKTEEEDPEFAVQLYDAWGPQVDVIRANREHVRLHPDGRLSVLDNSSDGAQNDNA